jgi:hypothetical protein
MHIWRTLRGKVIMHIWRRLRGKVIMHIWRRLRGKVIMHIWRRLRGKVIMHICQERLQVNLFFFVSLKYLISFTLSLAVGKTFQTTPVQSVLLRKFIRDLCVADLGISRMEQVVM